MIRQSLFAVALLAASAGASATGFGHVETHILRPVEHLSLSIGSVLHDGFNITYGIGGDRHVTRRHDYTNRVIVVPQPLRVIERHRHESRHSHWNRHDNGRRAWRDHDRHHDRRGWDDNNRHGDDRRGRDRNRSRH